MPCDSRTTLSNAISGSYGVYYLAPNQLSGGFNATDHYIGAIKADTLRIATGVNATPIYSDFLGPDSPIDWTLTPKPDILRFTLIEVNRPAAKRLIYPYSTQNNGATQFPGVSGEKPTPGRLQSSYEGRLRLVPLNGNVRYWDNDLTIETANQPPSGLNIRDYFHVTLNPDADTEEAYGAKLLEIPLSLTARLCLDTITGQWRTHGWVAALNSALT